jgi:hypothetical protein
VKEIAPGGYVIYDDDKQPALTTGCLRGRQ